MKTFKEFLLEKTFNIGKDVDLIYNKIYKKFVTKLNKNQWDGTFPNQIKLSSSMLSSRDAKKAHVINPISVIGFNGGQNTYNPVLKKISLNINSSALNVLSAPNYNIEDGAKLLGDRSGVWRDDISEKRIKGTIYHELSHWIDDTLHNSHIEKMLIHSSEVAPRYKQKVRNQGAKGENTSYYEINAQVHALKQMKRSVGKEVYDSWTWDDLIKKSSAIETMMISAKKYGDYERWKKDLLKRLSREKLLGKKMKYGYN